jgi:hypothetical protein
VIREIGLFSARFSISLRRIDLQMMRSGTAIVNEMEF